jgi:hypothetical protein
LRLHLIASRIIWPQLHFFKFAQKSEQKPALCRTRPHFIPSSELTGDTAFFW